MTFFYKIRCLDKQVEWLCGSGLFCLLSVSLCLCSAWVGWHNRMTGDAATGFYQMRTWKIAAASSLNGISCHTDKLAAMSELNFVARLICMEWDILQLKNNLSVLSGWLWNRDRSNLTVDKILFLMTSSCLTSSLATVMKTCTPGHCDITVGCDQTYHMLDMKPSTREGLTEFEAIELKTLRSNIKTLIN